MEFYHKLTAVFAKRVPDLLSDLSMEIERKDLEKIYFSAHSLKGMALSIGACVMAKISEEIECKSRAHGKIEDIRTLLADLESAFRAFYQEVTIWG